MPGPAAMGRKALPFALLWIALLLAPGLAVAQPQDIALLVEGMELTPGDEVPEDLAERGVIRLADLVAPSSLFLEPTAGDPVVLPIDEGRTVTLVENSRRTVNGKTYVIGVEQDTPGSRFVMQIEEGALRYGEIRLKTEVINLTAPQSLGSQLQLKMVTTDLLHPALQTRARKPLERNLPSANQQPPDPVVGDTSEDDTGPEVVKLMVVYTTAAMVAYDNFNFDPLRTIEDEIEFVVFLANLGYEDQGNVTLELVHTQQVEYVETGDIAVDLERLACPCDIKKKGIGDNHLNEVFGPWKTHEADIVSLWVNYNWQPGIAYIMNSVSTNFAPMAVNAVHWHAAMFSLSFDHEVGHNFGARHDRSQDNVNGKPYDFNHGHMNLAADKVTIMGYPSSCSDLGFSCTRWPLWSDPTYQPVGTWGVATGVNAADNARTLRESAPTVSQFFEQGENLIGCCRNYGGWFKKKWRPGACN